MKKSVLSLILVLCMFCSCIPLSVVASANQGQESIEPYPGYEDNTGQTQVKTASLFSAMSNDISEPIMLNLQSTLTRDTVLVLDNSVSMEGTPLVYLKQAAIKFCTQVLAADGENKVAIVIYDTAITNYCDFTSNISTLTNIINSMGGNGSWTNIDSGLTKADELLRGSLASVKNIVLMTDGVPTAGRALSTGRYSYSDYSGTHNASQYCYEYANALYENAKALQNNYSIYSLGFFHNMYADTKDFASKVLIDSQNAGYYEVINPDDLDFVFGDIADDITNIKKSGTFKYPGTFPSGTAAKDKYDFSATYYYDDAYFLEDSKTYNPHLSTMSLCFELSSWSSYDADSKKSGWSATTATKNARDLLTGSDGIGFEEFEYNNFWDSPPSKNSIGAVAANKKIIDSSKNECTLIALAVRGGGYYSEWSSNFTLGTSGEHEGFSAAKENVLTFLSQYITDKGITGNIKLWIVGYSRAGATANLVAGTLNSGRTLPNVTLAQKDLFAYTFEAPQGAMISQTMGNHKNIHNIINLNDVVPLVAQSVWNFARYNGSSYILPSNATSGFNLKKQTMLTEYYKVMESNLNGYKKDDYLYKIDEYTRTIEVKVDPWKILPGGDPFVKLNVVADKDYPQSQLLVDTITDISRDSIGSREKYVSNMQTGIEEIMELNNSYYDEEKDWLNAVFAEFTFEEIEYIISPIYSIKPFYSTASRIEDIGDRLIATFTKHCQRLGIQISQHFINSTLRVLADYIFSHPIHFAKLVDNIMRDSVMQAHIPEVCLAWLRSQDSYYTTGASFGTSSGTYRIIRINCPVDVDIYDSNNNLVASIMDDVLQDVDSEVIYIINENGEKVIYLPADEGYNVDLEATADGNMTYSVNELSLMSGGVKRIVNYYEVPLTNGETFTGSVPKLTSDELENDIPNGSSATYQLFNSSSAEVPASEDLKGGDIESNYYDVIVMADNNGGHVRGSGSFLKGTFAKVEAISQSGSNLLGWYNGDSLVSTEAEYRFAVTEDITLTAKFTPVDWHSLELKAGSGGKIASVEGTYTIGTEIAVVAEANSGYRFKNWTSSNGGVFADATNASTTFTMPDNNTTITANFESTGGGGGGGGSATTYTITFDTNGGNTIAKTTVTRNSKLAKPTDPTKDGFIFAGWFTDEKLTKEYDFNSSVTSSFTLYAKWTEDIDSSVEWQNPFADVKSSDWFYDAVQFVAQEGIAQGVSSTQYDPQGKVTRAQFITMLCRAYGIEEMTGDNFADAGNAWYTGYLAAAKQLGISNGVGNDLFAPDDEITREQMVVMLYNYASLGESPLDLSVSASDLTYADKDKISDWALEGVTFGTAQGWIKGKENNMFDPQGTATRAELAQIFYNIFN